MDDPALGQELDNLGQVQGVIGSLLDEKLILGKRFEHALQEFAHEVAQQLEHFRLGKIAGQPDPTLLARADSSDRNSYRMLRPST